MNLIDFLSLKRAPPQSRLSPAASGARFVASPEMAALSQIEQVKLLIDGAQLLLLAAKGLEARSRKA